MMMHKFMANDSNNFINNSAATDLAVDGEKYRTWNQLLHQQLNNGAIFRTYSTVLAGWNPAWLL